MISSKEKKKWAEFHNVTTQTIRNWIRSGWDPSEARPDGGRVSWKTKTGKTLREWADDYGVSSRTLTKYVSYGFALGEDVFERQLGVKYNGKTAAEWAELHKVKRKTVYRWINDYGWDGSDEAPVQSKNYVSWLDLTGKTLEEWADVYGISKQAVSERFHRAYRKGWDPKEESCDQFRIKMKSKKKREANGE